MVAITFSGIDQIDSQFCAFVENRIGFGLRIIVRPFTAQLPRPDANNRNSQPGATENSVVHIDIVADSIIPELDNKHHAVPLSNTLLLRDVLFDL